MATHSAGADTWELTFAAVAAAAGDPRGHQDRVRVRRTQSTGPGGHPVHCDDTGIVRAEISDTGEVRMLASSAQQNPRRPIACRLLHQRPQHPAA
jgi:hypothetical protein